MVHRLNNGRGRIMNKEKVIITKCRFPRRDSSECNKVQGCYCCKWFQTKKYVEINEAKNESLGQ